MKRALAVVCASVSASALFMGCHSSEKKVATPAAVAPSTAKVNVTVDKEPTFKKGVLIARLRVGNNTSTFISIVRDRCEVETTDGQRRRVFRGNNGITRVGPRDSGLVQLVFGEQATPLFGETFRLYLWAEPTDGSGVIANLPVVTIGTGSFATPAKPFSKDGAATETLPPPTDPPPTTTPTVAGSTTAQPAKTDLVKTDVATTCPNCGEARPATGNCPHCGLP
jgi:hypothetical protein